MTKHFPAFIGIAVTTMIALQAWIFREIVEIKVAQASMSAHYQDSERRIAMLEQRK